MTTQNRELLFLMRLALGNTADGSPSGDMAGLENVFRLAERHHVLPMVVNAAYRAYGNTIPWESLTVYKKRAQRMTYLQALKTGRFLSLYSSLANQGMAPLVMKGLICRELYPDPDSRFSADEDLLIRPDEAAAYREALIKAGLEPDLSEEKIVSEPETTYTSDDKVLLLEVHRYAIPPDSGAYGDYSALFDIVFDRAVTATVSGVGVRTMAPTDHLLYLICHALKHFMHGGFGIRQVCDIGLYAKAYAGQIDWAELTERIDTIRARDFTAALFAIAEEFLGITMGGVPDELRQSRNDPEALLEDILDSGVYGSSTMSRKHSANLTLRAAEAAGSERAGETGTGKPVRKRSRRRVLFPPAQEMAKRYPYLEKRPWLLPAAWIQRICRYLRSRDAANTLGEALRIGHERVDLMKTYGLLSEQPEKQVDTGQYLSALCELIDQGHEVSIPVAGSSMTPFLGDKRDQVFVKAPERPVRRGDIVLYRRRNGDFVLHRVYRVRGSGENETFDVIGDAQDIIERGIGREQVTAVVTRARRKGKLIEPGSFYWWFFQNIWIRMIPVRRMMMRVYTAIR